MSNLQLPTMVSIEYLLNIPSSISKPSKKWRSAFKKIYYSRTITPLPKLSNSKKQRTRNQTLPSPSYVAININPENTTFNIHQATLTKIVKTKNLNQLQELGGISGVASAIETTLGGGICGTPDDISRRQEAYGSNTYKKPPSKSFFYFVVEAFKDMTIAILLACAALSLAFGIKEDGIKEGWYAGGSVLVAVFRIITVSYISNYWQSRQFDKLFKISNNIKIEVLRRGRSQQVSIFDLVVGDVVCLKIGDQVPADGLFVDGHSLQIDESTMTGESDHVEINHQNPFLFSVSKVADGYGRMLITSVGTNTSWGKMMSDISPDTSKQTPFRVRLNKLTSAIGKVGLAVALLVLVLLLVRYFTGNTHDEYGNTEYIGSETKTDDIINAVVKIVAAAVTIVVVAIPEGLPLIVTLTLEYSMKRMMADQAMDRNLSACETMESATTICTDKTGTLTMNLMMVTKFWLGNKLMEQTALSSISPQVVELIKQGVSFNTTGGVYRANSGAEFEFSDSPTEKAILSWAVLELKMDMEEVKQGFDLVHVEAFNSKKKRSGALMRKKMDNTVHVHWKGAAEMILAMCSSFYNASGLLKDLGNPERDVFKQIIQGMEADTLCCIAFAHRQVSEEQYVDGKQGKKLVEDGLTLLGLVGIKDPCRPGVKKAVEVCQDAGVNIKMITGENVFIASDIAHDCGIFKPGQDMFDGAVVEGKEFRNYTMEERLEKVDKICVMARSSLFDKLLMVHCLKQKGIVVAVIGDGTNNAPALKDAYVGLFMGIQGTEVAKESSDIVILDDNLASVATVLQWGRCVYTNIQKFLQFQLTVNVAALVFNFMAVVSAGEVPLTAMQLLWVNLIVDTLGAVALSTENPTEELVKKSPVDRTEPFITNIMWRNLLAQAIYQISILLTLQFRGESIFGVTEKVNDTLIFNIFVLCQVFNEFNARMIKKRNVFKGIHQNKLFLGIIGVTIVLQVFMVELLKKFAGTERLNWGQWGMCIGFAALSWPIGWIVKCIPVPEKPIMSYLKCRK